MNGKKFGLFFVCSCRVICSRVKYIFHNAQDANITVPEKRLKNCNAQVFKYMVLSKCF